MTGGGGEDEREGGPGDGEGQRGEAGSEPGEWAVDPQECLRAGLRCVVCRESRVARRAVRTAPRCLAVRRCVGTGVEQVGGWAEPGLWLCWVEMTGRNGGS